MTCVQIDLIRVFTSLPLLPKYFWGFPLGLKLIGRIFRAVANLIIGFYPPHPPGALWLLLPSNPTLTTVAHVVYNASVSRSAFLAKWAKPCEYGFTSVRKNTEFIDNTGLFRTEVKPYSWSHLMGFISFVFSSYRVSFHLCFTFSVQMPSWSWTVRWQLHGSFSL